MYVIVMKTPDGGYDSSVILGVYLELREAEKIHIRLKESIVDKDIEIQEIKNSLKIEDIDVFENNTRKGLGLFKTPEEAALAYNEAAQKMFGEFASLNTLTPLTNI